MIVRKYRLITAGVILGGLAFAFMLILAASRPAALPAASLPTPMTLPSLTSVPSRPPAALVLTEPTAASLPPSFTPIPPSPTPALTSPLPVLMAVAPTAIPTTEPVVLPPPPQPVPNQVVITFNPGTSAQERQAYIRQIGGTVSQSISALNAVVVTVPDAARAQPRLAGSPLAQAEPDYFVTAQQVDDPLYPDQWALPVIGAPDVWTILPANAPKVAVAVIDSGICADHPDLAGRILPGWDFVQDDDTPQDEFGHGCAVSGVIAANADGAGIVGAAPNARILPLRVLNNQGLGTYSDVAAAIVYAADNGAQIINLSLGGSNASSVLDNAVDYAVARGVLVVAAAGNTGGAVLYPAAYAPVIAVASVDQNLQRSSFSSYGPEVDLLAPGRDILTTNRSGGYSLMSGTSFAAPHVSGAAALEIALSRQLALTGGIVSVGASTGGVTTPTAVTPPPTVTPAAGPIVTDTWAVILAPGSDPNAVAAQLGYENLGPIGSLANTYLFRASGSEQSAQAAQTVTAALQSLPQVVWFEQQIARQQSPRDPNDDPLYNQQWHLRPEYLVDITGEDINVQSAWTDGYTGTGVQIAIVDDGLQYTHPDIQPNYLASGSYDFNNSDSDPAPAAGDGHGTSAAGVAAAADNTTCGVGAAYSAQLSGLRLIAAPSTDAMEASALSYAKDVNDIYSSSWGPNDDGQTLLGPGPLTLAALQNGVDLGRGGLGSVFVWAAGNGNEYYDNANADGYANSRFVIAVSAVDPLGRQAYYSEPGAPIFVAAPSSSFYNGSYFGITTTDLSGADGSTSGDCMSTFGGTSSAAPLVAGVVALMLDANPNLSWRDVQHILARTAVQNHPGDADWYTNAGGFHVNHKYGFGRVDASAAVNMALTWTPVAAEQSATSGLITVNRPIPSSASGQGFTSTAVINNNLLVEHVEVALKATHGYRGQLQVVLTSPDGTQSRLIEPRRYDEGDDFFDPNDHSHTRGWQFSTVHSWGEHSAGKWTLSIVDRTPDIYSGTFNDWQITIYGTPTTPRPPYPVSPAQNAVIASSLPVTNTTFTWEAYGAVRSELQLGTTSNLDAVTPIPLTTTSYSTALAAGPYYWRLRAFDAADQASEWGAVRTFTIVTPANAAPVRNRYLTTAPELAWGRVSWATGYEIQVDDSPMLAAPYVYQNNTIPGGQLSISIPAGANLQDGRVYYWRVRAKDANGVWSPTWSAVDSFVIDVP